MSQGVDPVAVLLGLILILFGICLVFAGGLCTYFLLGGMFQAGGQGLGALLLLSVPTLGLGCLCIWGGIRAMRPPRN